MSEIQPTLPSTVSGWHWRVWRLAAPGILSNLSIPLVGAVDTAVVGHLSDPRYIGAVALGAVIFSFLFWGFGFLRMGTTGFIAQAHGRGDHEEVVATTLRGLLLAGLLGTLVVLVQKPVGSVAWWALDAGPELEKLASDYFAVRIWSAPATLANYVVLGVLIGLHRTGTALLLQLLLNGCNVALDIWLVLFLGQGVEGVAVASLASDWLAAVAGIAVLARLFGASCHGFEWRCLLHRERLLRLLAVNANIMIRTVCVIFAFFYFTAQGTRLGDDILAANAVLMHLQHFLAYGLDGFAHAMEALAGSAYGARRLAAFRAAIRAASIWSLGVAAAYALLYLVFGSQLIALLTSIDSVQDTAGDYLLWLAVSPLLSVWSFLLDGIFIGTTRTADMRNGMLLSLIIFLITSAALVPLWGNHGLWLALMVFMVARAVTLAVCYPRIEKALQRSLTHPRPTIPREDDPQ